jgi:hypothetical protein
MSTLQEHIARLKDLRGQDRSSFNEAAQQYQAETFLTINAHLDEIAALLEQVSRPAPCAAHLIAGAWQCEHCGRFELERPACEHAAAPAQQQELPELSDAAKAGISPMSAWPWKTSQPAASTEQEPACLGEIRAALSPPGRFQPTPGEWVADDHKGWVHPMTEVRTGATRDEGGHSIVRVRADFSCTVGKSEYEWANAAFVAACSPQNIRELLAYIDSLRAVQPPAAQPEPAEPPAPERVAPSIRALAEQLIEAAIDSDASGRPDGALYQHAIALRAALTAAQEGKQ